MSKKITWNAKGYKIDGKEHPFISGEFHYFRVPKKDWRFRLIKLKESGANAVATYIPWCVHEYEEGNIVFDDIPERDLTDFLKLCAELDLMVIARPGPYQYSELRRSGLPHWLEKNYPEVLARNINGDITTRAAVSYLHPLFLEKARNYIKAASDMIRPFLATNGGPIVMVQIDNEIAGVQVWAGSIDYNREGMGIGVENGSYTNFLKNKFGTVESMNEAYGTSYKTFTEVDPCTNAPDESTVFGKRFRTDYFSAYKNSLEEYAVIIKNWFEEDKLDVPYCLNAASINEIPLFNNMVEKTSREGLPTLLGTDHYYTLGTHWGWGSGPSQLWYSSWLASLDFIRELDQPPTLMELQGGSPSDFPPMLVEELDATYKAHEALGLKGSNYYVFTGGRNFKDTGNTGDLYDYNAAISADNEIRPHYYAQKERNHFEIDNAWRQNVDRSYCVQIGFTWEQRQTADRYMARYARDGIRIRDYTEDMEFALLGSGFLPRFREMGNELDVDKLLILPCDDRMSAEKQKNIVSFLEKGGKLIITPFIPEMDEDFYPCTILKDYIGFNGTPERVVGTIVTLNNGTNVYKNTKLYTAKAENGWETVAVDMTYKLPVALKKKVGAGEVLWFGGIFSYSVFNQNEMVEYFCEELGQKPLVNCSNRTVFTSVFEDGEHGMLFVINLLGGKQIANIKATINGKLHDFGEVQIPAMSVITLEA